MSGESAQRVQRICRFCGETFWATRADQQYHSNLCRQRAYRWRKRLAYHEYKVHYHLKQIADYLVFPDSKGYAAQTMTKARHKIDEFLDLYNVRRVK